MTCAWTAGSKDRTEGKPCARVHWISEQAGALGLLATPKAT
jgi:hypothetical protein